MNILADGGKYVKEARGKFTQYKILHTIPVMVRKVYARNKNKQL